MSQRFGFVINNTKSEAILISIGCHYNFRYSSDWLFIKVDDLLIVLKFYTGYILPNTFSGENKIFLTLQGFSHVH
jgi:hypothetical protein